MTTIVYVPGSYPLQCDFVASPLETWFPFPHLLSIACDLLGPTECDGTRCQSLSFQRPYMLLNDERHGPGTFLTPADNQPTARIVTEPILPRLASPQQDPPSDPGTRGNTKLAQPDPATSDPYEQ